MEQKKEQKPQPQGGRGDQPRREQPGNPAQPQRGGESERQRQQPNPTRQHQSGHESQGEHKRDHEGDEAGDDRTSGHSAYERHQQQPDKALKDF